MYESAFLQELSFTNKSLYPSAFVFVKFQHDFLSPEI